MPGTRAEEKSADAPFEGVEKLLSIRTRGGASLRARGRAYYEGLVALAGASVVSHRANASVDSYVLSESSLFVWDERLLLLTCGRTHLVEAALAFVEDVGAHHVLELSYSRHGERRPEVQPSRFAEDVARLRTRLGASLSDVPRSGELLPESLHLGLASSPIADEPIFRILCFDIDGARTAPFESRASAAEPRAALVPIEGVLEHALVHEHRFEPVGYSLNALEGRRAYALHVSPERDVRFASFVTTDPRPRVHRALLDGMRSIFRPERTLVSTDARAEAAVDAPWSRMEGAC